MPILVFGILLAPLVWVTLRSKDLWPFSHYPMFSRLTNLSQVEVFRIALETHAGEVVWWSSEFYRYPEFVGQKLKQIYALENQGGKAAALASMERQRYLAEVLRLIEIEEGSRDRFQAVQIVRRSVFIGDGKPTPHDQVLVRMQLADIKRIPRAD